MTSAPAAPLAAHHLVRHFGGVKAVDDVSLTLAHGRLHAVIGTNGAGKSTLIDLLAGETRPTAGRIELHGHDATGWSQPRRAHAGLGRTYQRSTIFPAFSVLENCRLGAQARTPRAWDWFTPAATCARSTAAAWRALEQTGLVAAAGRLAGTLSHGGKRQLEIAICLATAPRVLLLDEPLAGMDAAEADRMLALLEALKPDHAMLLVEHDMDAVFRVADRITVMTGGRVLASDAPAAVRANPAVQVAYLGERP